MLIQRQVDSDPCDLETQILNQRTRFGIDLAGFGELCKCPVTYGADRVCTRHTANAPILHQYDAAD